jgi:hypothetical protein
MLTHFTIGADPEFCCVANKNRVLRGSCLFTSGGGDEFGADGGGVVFEIRPQPNTEPLKVVSNIHKIFVDGITKFPALIDYEWLAGSYYGGQPMGGHIHFGIGSSDDRTYSDITAYLSNYLGNIFYLIEDKKQIVNRRKMGYGSINDYRSQPHGFEYRTLGSWLTSPYVAAAVLCLSKVLVFERVNCHPKIPVYTNYTMFQDAVRNFPRIWEDITKMQLYQEYKIYVDFLYYLVENKLTWFPKEGMKNAWGLCDLSSINGSGFSLQMIWQRYINRK